MNMQARMAMNAYNRTAVQTSIESASPHRLIQMLLDGAMDKMAAGRGLMERGEVAGKGRMLSWAISIIGGLRSSLDAEAGGEIAANLDRLYDYISRRLYEANRNNDLAAIDEAMALLREVKTAWEGIGEAPPSTGA